MKGRPKQTLRRLAVAAYERWTAVYWHQRYETYRARHELHPSFRFNGHDILIFGDGIVRGGENSYIGRHSTLYAHEGTTIELGHDVSIAANVRIDTQSVLADQDRSAGLECKVGSVRIGDWAWIGTNAYIAPGVTIGENSVIAANSVVVGNVPGKTVLRPVAGEQRPQAWPNHD